MNFPPNVLMRIGDTGTFVCHVEMDAKYHITVGKEYLGTIKESREAYTSIAITNDIGVVEVHECMYGSFNGGFATITSCVAGEELVVRKLTHINGLIKTTTDTYMKSLRNLQDCRDWIRSGK